MKTSFQSTKDLSSLVSRFVLHFYHQHKKHALCNIVLLYHSIISSFNLKLWSINGLDLEYEPIVPCHFNVGVKSVKLCRSSYLR